MATARVIVLCIQMFFAGLALGNTLYSDGSFFMLLIAPVWIGAILNGFVLRRKSS
jgi:hypothetical protein